MWDVFLLSLFQGAMAQITVLPVKQARIALPNPTRTAGANWKVSCLITGHLISAHRGTAEFRSGKHTIMMGEGRE